MTEQKVLCPKCGSAQIHAEKRGWKWTTGVFGSGMVFITCLKCGRKFKPGEGNLSRSAPSADWSSKEEWKGGTSVYTVSRRSQTKTCPDCAENVLAEARKCRFCGFVFPDAPPSSE